MAAARGHGAHGHRAAAIFAVTVAAGLLVIFGDLRLRQGQRLDWQVAGLDAPCSAALIVVALQMLGAHQAQLLPGLERLRLLLYRLGGHEHRCCSWPPSTGSRPSWPGRCACAGP